MTTYRPPTVLPVASHPRAKLARRRRVIRRGGGAAALSLLLGALAACASGTPSSPVLPAASAGLLPSLNVSPIASAAAQAALDALDQVNAAIAANTSPSGLSSDDASSLTRITANLRVALQTGDMTAAKAAASSLSDQATQVAANLGGDAATKLKNAVAALKAALGSS